jgi:NAD(P)-dependent dehydrogenase (short-subunit alcohol dehydrogenase family)
MCGRILAVLALLFAVSAPMLKKYFAGGVNPFSPDLEGKVFIVTGANTGIGYETARELVRLRATVIFAGRDLGRISGAVSKVAALYPSHSSTHVVPMALDLGSLASVRSFASSFLQKFSRLDGLINNAGVMVPPRTNTTDGFELQMGTNHFGHFLLTHLLLDVLKSTAATTGDARVITVSSRAHERGHIDFDDINWNKRSYSRFDSYAQSKLANVVFASELARRTQGTQITSISLHPGVIRTELARYIPFADTLMNTLFFPFVYVFMKDPWEGAQTQLYAALAPVEAVKTLNGKYLVDCVQASMNPEGSDPAIGTRLWELSEEAVGISVTA